MPYMVQYMHSKQTNIPYTCKISKKFEFEKRSRDCNKSKETSSQLEPIRNI